ncbi:MAG: metal-dependent hydrolase [Schwartzia sp.]|nr:metal-dependent hydrolase [Schwartzia sp. (in: firmicutes)]
MTKTTHIALGLYAALGTHTFFLPAMFGAALPDIDIAWGYKRTRDGFKPRPNMPKWLGHRGFTHWFVSYLPLLGASFVLHPATQAIVHAFLVGVASHLLADMMTPGGIPVFSFKRRASLRLVKTRSATEYALLALLTLGLFLLPKSLYLEQFIFLKLFTNLL